MGHRLESAIGWTVVLIVGATALLLLSFPPGEQWLVVLAVPTGGIVLLLLSLRLRARVGGDPPPSAAATACEQPEEHADGIKTRQRADNLTGIWSGTVRLVGAWGGAGGRADRNGGASPPPGRAGDDSGRSTRDGGRTSVRDGRRRPATRPPAVSPCLIPLRVALVGSPARRARLLRSDRFACPHDIVAVDVAEYDEPHQTIHLRLTVSRRGSPRPAEFVARLRHHARARGGPRLVPVDGTDACVVELRRTHLLGLQPGDDGCVEPVGLRF